ncbi:hypothetical protein ACQP1W_28255 [Spirillospora sp. CA-255316]
MRSGPRLGPGERAADRVRDALGSWAGVATTIVLVAVLAAAAARHDHRAGPVAVTALILAGLAPVGAGLVLMAIRRHDHTVGEQALFDLDTAHRAEVRAAELTRELERLRTEVARLAARVETAGRACTANADTPDGGAGPAAGPDEDSDGRAVLGWRP